jgi:plastocyanin
MTLSRKALLVLVGCAAGSLTALACFSERGAGPGPSGAAECSVPVSVIDSMHVIVAIRNFAFVPDSILVPVGGTVTWVNCEDFGHDPHTTTSDTSGVWDSSDMNTGARFSHRFATAGAFPYHCTPHAFMKAKVIVQ